MDTTGKVQTVLGLIEPEELGITLTHEHCFIDQRVWFQEPTTMDGKMIAEQPMSYDILWYVRYHPYSNLDNLCMIDEETTIRELSCYQRYGGNSIVDVTPWGIARDPQALARVSRATGLNIVMGTGPYVKESLPKSVKRDRESIAARIIQDIQVGADGTDIRSGIIGEIGMQWPLTEVEKTFLQAAADAQKETKAPINVHPGFSPDCPFDVLDVLDGVGARIDRLVMSHVDGRIFDIDRIIELAKSGCYVEFDLFGFEGWHGMRTVKSEATLEEAHMPCDAKRVDNLKALIEAGFLSQLVIAHDTDTKHHLRCFGGGGYAHILANVVPLMRRKGITEEQIETILVKNPAQLLRFG